MDASLIQQFKELTNTSDQEATFHLEAANGDLETAVSNYFGGGSNNAPPTTTTTSTPPTSTTQQQQQQQQQKRDDRRGMFTFKDMNEDFNKKDDSNSNRYYAGGSTSSGNLILGKDDVNNNANDITSQIFKKAQEMGAKNAFEAKSEPQEKFSGSGKRLGSEPSSDNEKQNAQQQQEAVDEKTVTITFYQDGFTIDDGELRKFSDPNNQKFLEAINNGYVPREVAGMAKEVLVNLVDKKSEVYAPPKQSFQAFKGDGRTLSSRSSSTSAPPVNQPVTTPSYSVDTSRPHTTIQIRLHDGTRMNATFNLDATVKALMQFVQAARPNVGQFQLQTSFPRKILTDPNQTIEQAGLKGAVILQSLI